MKKLRFVIFWVSFLTRINYIHPRVIYTEKPAYAQFLHHLKNPELTPLLIIRLLPNYAFCVKEFFVRLKYVF